VNDLHVSNQTPTAIMLSWTAPGDDLYSGTASLYALRYVAGTSKCTELDSEEEWSAATPFSVPTGPKPAGQQENVTVTGLTPGHHYCFALETSDNASNVSKLSSPVAYGSTYITTVDIGGAQAANTQAPNGNPVSLPITGVMGGTVPLEVSLAVPRPFAVSSFQLSIIGDSEGASLTASLRDARFNAGEADLFTKTASVSGGRFAASLSAADSTTKISTLTLPAGTYILRLVSNDINSGGVIAGTATFGAR
jgi:hypothetical protein